MKSFSAIIHLAVLLGVAHGLAIQPRQRLDVKHFPSDTDFTDVHFRQTLASIVLEKDVNFLVSIEDVIEEPTQVDGTPLPRELQLRSLTQEAQVVADRSNYDDEQKGRLEQRADKDRQAAKDQRAKDKAAAKDQRAQDKAAKKAQKAAEKGQNPDTQNQNGQDQGATATDGSAQAADNQNGQDQGATDGSAQAADNQNGQDQGATDGSAQAADNQNGQDQGATDGSAQAADNQNGQDQGATDGSAQAAGNKGGDGKFVPDAKSAPDPALRNGLTGVELVDFDALTLNSQTDPELLAKEGLSR